MNKFNGFIRTKVFSAAAHFGGLLAVTGGVIVLGPPAWAVGTGAAIAGIITAVSLARERKTIMRDITPYPADSALSPNLGKIAADLYKKSGLKSKNAPIYGFRLKADVDTSGKSFTGRLAGKIRNRLRKRSNLKAGMPQATSLSMVGKPAIVISEPLLKLLDENETKAVLAHEFARAAGHHQQFGTSHGFVSRVLVTLNSVTLRYAMLASGPVGYIAMFAERGVPRLLMGANVAWGKILNKKKRTPTLKQMARQKRISNTLVVTSAVAATAVVSYINPVYLGVFVGVKVLSSASKFLNNAFSRSLEHEADRGITALGADPLALITALRKIEMVKKGSIEKTYKGTLSEPGRLTKAWRRLNSNQPDADQRIKRLADIARKKGASESKIKAAVSGPLKVLEENYLAPEVVKGPLKKSVL